MKLEQSFSAWRNGTISNGELSYRLHQYETGPSRELYKRYHDTPADMAVAYAIVWVYSSQTNCPKNCWQHLAGR